MVVSDEVGQVYVFGSGSPDQWAHVHMDQVPAVLGLHCIVISRRCMNAALSRVGQEYSRLRLWLKCVHFQESSFRFPPSHSQACNAA